ncbi:TetR/AcrR family transcriptional regulator [Aliihoeflea sp. PC F10.4]
MASPQQRSEQYASRRRALIMEAGRAFARKGFHNTSLDEVASSLNVTKPALYYYIRTKQEILFECHNLTMDIAQRAKEYAFVESDKPANRLRLFLYKYITLLTSEFGGHSILLEPVSSLTPDQREFILERRRGFDRMLRGFVEQSVEDGTIRPCNSALAVNFFMGALSGLPRWFSPQGALSGEDVANAYLEFVFDGLSARPA